MPAPDRNARKRSNANGRSESEPTRAAPTAITPPGRQDEGQKTVATPPPHPVIPGDDSETLEFIGGYRILGVLGEGGMGVVYEAEQQNPRRKVALKVIHGRHHADEFHVKLFQREADSLGRLKHPGIGAIYESGHTGEGRHFFAMELVRGQTLDAFCRTRDSRQADRASATGSEVSLLNRSEVALRLGLFLKVCDAVNYAHQRGVIHRDLKPSNIMVSEGSSAPSIEVKVLDFGLARISDPDAVEATMMTEAGTIRGTPAYMSPEQARGAPEDIDLRSDVYSLGVILYEMLTGVRPVEIQDVSILEAVRIICDVEPVRLRKATLFASRLDPELELIVHKALAKDPSQRYQSVSAFADDVTRFLNDEPVLASPPSATYRLRKLVKRHRALFASLAAVATVLLGASIVSTTYYFRAERESARARTEAAKSEQVAAFLGDMLKGVGPAVARGRDTSLLREVLDGTAARISTDLHDQPEVEATLSSVLGLTYRELGEYETAEGHLLRARDLWQTHRGALDPRTLEATVEIANLDYFLGEMAQAESLIVWAGDHLERIAGPNDPSTLAARAGQAQLLLYRGELDQAAAIGERIVPLLRSTHGDAHEVTQAAMFNLCQTYADQLRYDEAESNYLELLEILERELGSDHPRTLSAKVSCGWLYRLAGKHEPAERYTREALSDMRRVLGNDHSETLIAVNNLAIIYKDLGRYSDAEPLYLENLETGIRVLGEKHPENLPSLVNIAAFYQSQGRWPEATAMADRAVTTFTDVMPEGHIGIAFARMTRGQCLLEAGKLVEAEPDLLAAQEVMDGYFPSDHRHVQKLHRSLVRLYEELGRPAQSAFWQERTIPES